MAHYVNYYLRHFEDVFIRMLGRLVTATPGRRKYQDGRIGTEAVEVTNGLRLTLPFTSMVLAKAMGLGITEPNSSACIRVTGVCTGSIVMAFGV